MLADDIDTTLKDKTQNNGNDFNLWFNLFANFFKHWNWTVYLLQKEKVKSWVDYFCSYDFISNLGIIDQHNRRVYYLKKRHYYRPKTYRH